MGYLAGYAIVLALTAWVLQPVVARGRRTRARICPNCGPRTEGDARYCSNCGAKLTG
jgi:predicted amidophosphoribosyltransferase